MGEGILLGPLVLFAAVMSLTPGPNVIMVTASAANFGFGRTIPQMLGDADRLCGLAIRPIDPVGCDGDGIGRVHPSRHYQRHEQRVGAQACVRFGVGSTAKGYSLIRDDEL